MGKALLLNSSQLTFTCVHSGKRVGSVDVRLKHIRMNGRESKRNMKEELQKEAEWRSDAE